MSSPSRILENQPAREIRKRTKRRRKNRHGQLSFERLEPRELLFNPVGRWTTTATDGGGLTQGDPTTLTWSLVGDGTFIPGASGEPDSNSTLIAFLDTIIGAGPGGNDLTQRPWFSLFDDSLTRISDLSGLTFLYEPNDDGAAFDPSNSAPGVLGTRGDIRIGGHFVDGSSSILAYNFFPDNGDMVIDTGDSLFFGDISNNFISFRNTVVHEHGHGLGLGHVESSNANFNMEPIIDVSFDGPQLDDILGLQRLYGDALEKNGGNDSSATATPLGSIGFGQTVSLGTNGGTTVVAATDTDFLSIDDESDVDFFQFSVADNSFVSLSVTPRGTTYLVGPQGGPESPFNSARQSDLRLELVDSDGSTVLQTADARGLGGTETISDFVLAAGTYFVRVSGSTTDTIQLYGLDIFSVNELSVDFGDAPAPFPTLLADNGAFHLNVGATLGATRDAENEGRPNATATGDNSAGSSDEDGFVSQSLLVAGGSGSITVDVQGVTGTYFLSAWVDFNRDGDWADAGEQIAIDVAVTTDGNQVLNFIVPSTAVTVGGPSIARFRLSTVSGLAVTGGAPDGEVEDHVVIVGPQSDLVVTQTESIDPVIAGSRVGNLTYVVTVGNNGPSAATGVALAVDLTLPAGVTLVSATPSAGSFSFTTAPDGIWSNVNLAVGQIATLTVVVTAGSSAASGVDVIASTATIIASNSHLLNTNNDTVTTRTSIGRQVDLAISQIESSDPVKAGSGDGNLTYEIKVTNKGPSNATGIRVFEDLTLPAGVSLSFAYPSQGSLGASNAPDVNWLVGNLAKGASATLQMVITVGAAAINGTDVIVSTASITASNEALFNRGNDVHTIRTSIGEIPPNVDTSFVPDPDTPGGLQLVITGGDKNEQIALDLGAGGFANTLLLRGVNGTTINGSQDKVGLNGFTSIAVRLLGGNDVITLNGNNITGTVFVDGGLGDDTYSFAATKTRFSINDPGGRDTFDYSQSPKAAKVNLSRATGRSQSMGGGNSLKLFSQIEDIVGSPFNDTLKGNAVANNIFGGGGNDRLDGGPGNDLLRGGAGNDKIKGGTGNDILLGEAGADTLTAGEGADILIGGLGQVRDRLIGNTKGNTLLIGSSTTSDNNDVALRELLSEWANLFSSLDTRIDHLTNGGGNNGATVLTVVDDFFADSLSGRFGGNWFIRSIDKIRGATGSDRIKT